MPAEQSAAGAPDVAPTCPKCNGEMWDNRESKKNPRAPDYKCKSAGCEGVIWPPRDPDAPAVVAKPAGTKDDPACPVCGGKMWDDRASKRNPRAPDFKCRNKPKYQGAPGCEGVIWPPREGDRSRATPAQGSARTSASPARSTRAPSSPPPRMERELTDAEAPGNEDDDLPF